MSETQGRPQFFTRRVSRRRALGGMAAGVGIMAASRLIPTKTGEAKSASEPAAQTPEPAEKPPEAPKISAFDTLLHLQKPEEIQAAQEKVANAQAIYEKDSEVVLGRLKQYESIINEKAEKYNIPKDILEGLVFIESKGDAHAVSEVSPNGYVGLGQVGKDEARQYGARVDGVDERLNPKINLEVTAHYLSDLRDLFGGDLGLAFLAYNDGPGHLFQYLRTYFQAVYKKDFGSPIKDDLGTNEESLKIYKELIRKENFSIHGLIENPHVKGWMKEETQEYVYKAVAATNISQKYK